MPESDAGTMNSCVSVSARLVEARPRTTRTSAANFDPRPYQGPGHPAVLYRYSPDRKGERPRSHLDGFNGYLHADAFAGYQALYRTNGRNAPQLPTWLAWRTPDARCSRYLKTRSRRSPKRHCGGSRNSMPSKPTSRAEPSTNVGRRGRRV